MQLHIAVGHVNIHSPFQQYAEPLPSPVPLSRCCCRTWSRLVGGRLSDQGLGSEGVTAALQGLAGLLDTGRLLAETRLATATGTHIRAGSTLMLTTMPEGRILLQGERMCANVMCQCFRYQSRA
jgi:hypothetical protein